MSLQASAEANYFILDSLMKAMQNHVFIKDYAIVKVRFKSNNSENMIKIVLLCDRDEQSRRTFKAQAKRIDNIKCNYLLKINVVYKKTLNI